MAFARALGHEDPDHFFLEFSALTWFPFAQDRTLVAAAASTLESLTRCSGRNVRQLRRKILFRRSGGLRHRALIAAIERPVDVDLCSCRWRRGRGRAGAAHQ
jgi:hypothetical protein